MVNMSDNLLKLEVTRNERKYQLSLPNDSPLVDMNSVLLEMLGFVVSKIDAIVKAQEEEAKLAASDKEELIVIPEEIDA